MKPNYTFRALMLPLYSFLTRSTKALLYLFLLSSGAYTLHAEGTKEVMPTAANGTGLIVSTSTGFPLGNVGSYLGAPSDNQIKFRIKNYTIETLYYGFNWEPLSPNGNPSGTSYNNIYMIIYDPTGAQVGTPINLPSASTPAPAAGYISTWASATFGPKIGTFFTSGYTPLTFTPTMNGDYHVSFYQSTDGGKTHNVAESMLSKYFDMTVAQTVAAVPTKFPGRVHCNEWAFSVYNPASQDIQDPLASTNAQFFAYTPDSVDVRVYFPKTGFQPLSYIVAFNSFGVKNNGNWLNDRKSIVLQQLDTTYLRGGFDVFLNQPDPTIYVPCAIPRAPTLVSPTISGCPPGPFNVRFRAPQAGDYYILFDLNGIAGYQANSADRFIELINQSPGIITYVWDGKDGLGNPEPANFSFPITFSFRKGRINIPFYDVELNVNGFNVDGIAPVNSVMQTLYWDDTQLSSVGTDCSTSNNGSSPNNNNYTGTGYNNSVTGITPIITAAAAVPYMSHGRAWNGNGNITDTIPAPYVIDPSNNLHNDKDNVQCNDFGNARLINTWAWGVDSTITQNLKLTCISVSGKVWDDADGSAAGAFTNIPTNTETGTAAGSQLYANLIDPVSGTVLSSVAVAADGTYILLNCPINATGMQVVISTTAGVANSTVASGIPAAWVNTSPLAHPFDTQSSNITGIDFGIEQLPAANAQHYVIAVPNQNTLYPLNGVGTIASPGPLTGADPEDGKMGSGKIFVITSLPTNEALYYNNVLVTLNTTIANYNPALLQIKFINVSVLTTTFQYAWIDAAGRQGSSANYQIDMTTILATTLGSFTGRSVDVGNLLNWTSYNETNGVYFMIERSSDGTDFTVIGRVDGASNGGAGNYAFPDAHPVPGVPNYYRLVMMDNTGGAFYSNIVTITATGEGSAVVEVVPNPFQDALSIKLTLPQTEKVSLRLLDSKGMLLRQAAYGGVKGTNTLQLSGLGSLPISVYFIQIVLFDQVFVRKVFNR